MGFLKDINKLRKQAKEIDKTFDPAAQMRDAKAAMEQASEVMTLQAEAARLAAGGEPAHAQVNTTRDTGQLLNLQPVLELSLLVFAGDRPPYPMTVRQVVPVAQLGRLTPGSHLAVKVDPAKPEAIWVDWAAS